VLFWDIARVKHEGLVSVVDVDKMFVEVCEFGSLKIISAQSEDPIAIGAGMYTPDKFYIKTKERVTTNLNVVISGVRKGYGGRRFLKRTKEDYESNMSFWASIT